MRIAGKLQEATQLKAQVEAAAAQAANVQQQQTNMTQAPGGMSSQINLNQLTGGE
jgi:hypothetical protein